MNTTIYYMWNFKPDEKNEFPRDVIINNLNYVKNFKIITPPTVIDLISKNKDIFPDLLKLYNMIPHWIIKADLGRLLIIYFMGGIYSDMDCFIKKDFLSETNNYNAVLFTEHICTSIDQLGLRESKNPENMSRLANFCFYLKFIKHPFFKKVIDECINRLKKLLLIEKKQKFTHEDILWVCGPDVITTLYHKLKKKEKYNDVILLDNTYLQHVCYGSWR
jgi:mannosyltransferase OCH1-like enzyme